MEFCPKKSGDISKQNRNENLVPMFAALNVNKILYLYTQTLAILC